MRILICLEAHDSPDAILNVLNKRVWPLNSEAKILTVVRFTSSDEFTLASKSVSRALNELSEKLPGLIFSHQIETGDPQQVLVDEATNWNADLIIVGMRPNHVGDPLLLQSVSQTMLEQLQCSVIVAKEASSSKKAQEKLNILVPLEHSKFSEAVVHWLASQTWLIPVHIKLVSIVPALHRSFHEDCLETTRSLLTNYEEMEKDALEYLQKWKSNIDRKIPAGQVTCQLAYGDVRDNILALANSWEADLIVMGSHGSVGIARILEGSVSRTVSIHSSCSVEVVKESEPARVNQI